MLPWRRALFGGVAIMGGPPPPLPVPAMTAPTTDGFTADASSELNPSYPAWKAFDGDKTTFAASWSSASDTSNKWLRLQLPQTARLTAYEIVMPGLGGGQYGPLEWRIEGWTGAAWVIVDQRSGQAAWTDGERRSFQPNGAAGAYSQYRLFIPFTGTGAASEGRQVYVNELTLSLVQA